MSVTITLTITAEGETKELALEELVRVFLDTPIPAVGYTIDPADVVSGVIDFQAAVASAGPHETAALVEDVSKPRWAGPYVPWHGPGA